MIRSRSCSGRGEHGEVVARAGCFGLRMMNRSAHVWLIDFRAQGARRTGGWSAGFIFKITDLLSQV